MIIYSWEEGEDRGGIYRVMILNRKGSGREVEEGLGNILPYPPLPPSPLLSLVNLRGGRVVLPHSCLPPASLWLISSPSLYIPMNPQVNFS